MRVIYKDCVSEITDAFCIGKQLIFVDCHGKHYYTDDYYHENIAMGVLNDLAVDGYVRVKNLHIKEDF